MSKLTDATRGKTCVRCQGPDAYACHYNGLRQIAFGKGTGIKCHDIATADLCKRCDDWFTEGSTKGFDSKIDRSEQFLFYVVMTNIRRFEDNTLKT